MIWLAFLGLIVYGFVKSFFGAGAGVNDQPRGGPGGGPFRPGGPDNMHPPPPYSKDSTDAAPAANPWRPGFWTGAALAGIGGQLLNNRNRQPGYGARPYDWEDDAPREERPRRRQPPPAPRDRGEGSSNLGSMRSSTGLGGSSVR